MNSSKNWLSLVNLWIYNLEDEASLSFLLGGSDPAEELLANIPGVVHGRTFNNGEQVRKLKIEAGPLNRSKLLKIADCG